MRHSFSYKLLLQFGMIFFVYLLIVESNLSKNISRLTEYQAILCQHQCAIFHLLSSLKIENRPY